jgi:ubiquinol-cytochrome c reductase cytochrome b subunit
VDGLLSERTIIKGLAKAFNVSQTKTRGAARWVGKNVGGSGVLREELRHIFPDHWSFFFGEIALYCFIILVATGVYMALFFHASGATVVYSGSYEPLQGVTMTDAYRSVVDLSLDVRAGLLMRQVHHWAALVFACALGLHLFRMFFTGAYRRPRIINWMVGLTMFLLVALNGVFGYSLPDDLLSGTGLRIAYSITESIPLVGPWLASVMFGGVFPSEGLIPRLYPVHIFLVPAAIGGLLGLHLGVLWLQRHTQFPGSGRDERTVVGTPLVPAYALRTVGFFLIIAGGLAVLGGFFQINPVWIYGPYHPWDSTTLAQPDWYTGWLEGAVRLWPPWDIVIDGFRLPGLFWPAVVLPGLVFTPLLVWPLIERLITGDDRYHNLLDRPREHPVRTAIGAGTLTFLFALLFAGGDDVWAVLFGWRIETLVLAFRIAVIALPPMVAVLTYYVCEAVGASQRSRSTTSATRIAAR